MNEITEETCQYLTDLTLARVIDELTEEELVQLDELNGDYESYSTSTGYQLICETILRRLANYEMYERKAGDDVAQMHNLIISSAIDQLRAKLQEVRI